MGAIIEFLIRRKVIVYLLTVFILLAEIGSVFTFKRELLPKADFPQIVVSITGDAIPPEEIEDKVTKPIEKEIKTLSNVEDYSSTIFSGGTTISIKAAEGKGTEVKTDVQSIVNRLRNSFPQEIKEVNITQASFGDDFLMEVALTGKDLPTLYNIAQTTIKDRVEQVEGVREVQIVADNLSRKIEITFNPSKLDGYQVTPQQVMAELQGVNWKQAIGTLSNDSFDTVIEVDNTLKTVQDIRRQLIQTPLGSIPLSELADIKDLRGKNQEAAFFYNGEDFIDLIIFKADGSDVIQTVDRVQSALNQMNQEANGHYQLTTYIEAASFVKNAINNLGRDVCIGGVLAILILMIFLKNWRVTLVIATTLPLSVMMTFLAMKIGGYNIDLVSLISLSLSMGLIVDAGIVVLESIYHFRERGEELKASIIKGVKEVLTPVLTSQFTIIVVFLPLALANIGGKSFVPVMMTITFTVSVAIVSSTIAALFFVPVFCERFLKHDKQMEANRQRQAKNSKLIDFFLSVLSLAIRHRLKTIGLSLLLLVGATVLASQVKMGSINDINENYVRGQIKMFKGTSFDVSTKVALEAEAKLRKIPEVKEVFVIAQKTDLTFHMLLWGKSELKDRRSKEPMLHEMNQALSSVKGTERVSVGFGNGSQTPIELEIRGKDFDTMRKLSDQMIGALKTIEGVQNPRSDFSDSVEKVILIPKHDALQQLGMDESSVMSQLSAWVNPQHLTKITIDDLELDVTARYPEELMSHPEELKQVMISAPSGMQVPLLSVVDWKMSKSLEQIHHKKGERVATIQAELVGSDLGTVGKAIQNILVGQSIPNGYQIEMVGVLKTQSDNLINGVMVFLGVLALIYVIMVGQFNRLSHPFLILLTLPMAVVGVVVGMVVTGRELNELALVGVIMLIGIVVSNAILLIDRINILREREGMELNQAIIEGTKNRIRPVIMTKLTAILGMLPLALALSEGSSMEAPLATVVIFGLAFHTLITLILVPVLYSLFASFSLWVNSRKQVKQEKQKKKSIAAPVG
ncbi:efflux RND transporter permease subunit [Ammoniphilus resinae]|uniref:HAE1 family hydrophobic/amphiphilic exporter-1 n=1 Tax=Ammoniphilus resinae TaxID=861532 RepID=A0ABS4GRW5_9BACL|nr:efflux RND transporter permease subunit [Ammoniphilus resinae]MBP1932999.1 HAE1 family hydrophobic/amphiphilic exporter-1 [Ammoniphilus resinae]